MNNYREIGMPELAIIDYLVDVYALRLARAYVAQDNAAANEIYDHIRANYGDIEIGILKQRAADMVISGFVK